jgi:hypothetical protein
MKGLRKEAVSSFAQKVRNFTKADVPMGKRKGQVGRPVVSYVLRMAIANNDLEIYFTAGPQSANLPLDSIPIKILKKCVIKLEIDKALNCTFVNDNSVHTMTLSSTAVAKYYWNLKCAPNAKSLQFEADWNNAGALGNPHPFNVYVVVDQPPFANGKPSRPLPIKIDPDIQNPGDPHPLLPPWT